MIARHGHEPGATTQFFSSAGVQTPAADLSAVSPRLERRGSAAPGKGRGRKSDGKPYKSFPLTPHKSGQFCKKIRGKIHYFGKIDDPDAALRRYYEHANGLHSGVISQVDRTGEVTVAELATDLLSHMSAVSLNNRHQAAFKVKDRIRERFSSFSKLYSSLAAAFVE